MALTDAGKEYIMNQTDFLQGKCAIVTGASGGIGSALCKKLAGYGMNLILSGRSKEALEKTAQLVRDGGGNALICAGDLTSIDYLRSLPQQAVQAFGRLDVVINNAGQAQHSAFTEVTEEMFDSIMATNVKAPYFLCQYALPYLQNSEEATIINICSVVAHKGYPLQSTYAASKHALLGFSKSLANETYDKNIRVHVISPGAVYTRMSLFSRPDLSPEGMPVPEDVADIVGFYLEHRHSDAVIDEIELHRSNKAPFA